MCLHFASVHRGLYTTIVRQNSFELIETQLNLQITQIKHERPRTALSKLTVAYTQLCYILKIMLQFLTPTNMTNSFKLI